jgi:predicted small metal-binding protein
VSGNARSGRHFEEARMGKYLECGAVVPGCRFVIHADGDEAMKKAVDHARVEHGIEFMSQQLKARYRAAIKDEPSRDATQAGSA